jgi:glycosyltransferase involved in cell wall biosynthesis
LIYFCIPARDEERTVGVLLWKIRQVMITHPRDYQLLVLDDGSSDATREVLEPYTRILPLSVYRFPEPQGYGAALESLLREAVQRSRYPKRDIIVTLQADFTDDPDEVPALLKGIESGADVVAGVRKRLNGRRPPLRERWLRAGALYLLRRLHWPEPVTDPLTGFRAYRVMTVKAALDARNGGRLLEWNGWAADAALLHATVAHARRVEEEEVTDHGDRRQRPSRFDAWSALRDVVRLVRGRARGGGDVPEAPLVMGAEPQAGRRVRRRRGASGDPTAPATATQANGAEPDADAGSPRTGSRGRRRGRRSGKGGARESGAS